jgi:hypothetical protein
MRTSITLIITILLCGSACAPYPHFVTHAPNVSGTLTLNGVPLSGVIVKFTHAPNDESCSNAAGTSITDAGGYFDMDRVKEFKFFSTMGDRFYSNKLCIIKDGKTYVVYSDKGTGYPPDSIRLKCNLDMDGNLADKVASGVDTYRLAACTMAK